MLLFGKEIGLLEFKKGRIILIKFFEDLSHNGFSHELGLVSDLILIAIEVYGILFPAVEQNGCAVAPL